MDKNPHEELEQAQGRAGDSIRLSIRDPDLAPHTTARGVTILMLKAFPFVFLAIAVAVVLAFPTPHDVLKVSRIVPPDSMVTLVPTQNGPNIFTLSSDTPAEPFIARIEETGCLDRLPNLPEELVETCSKLVAEAVIEIAAFEEGNTTDLTTESGLLVERLRLAATKVCRARWASEPGMFFDPGDPVCSVSTINLASLN